ncbi:hypothetical protein BC832DRAFT_556430 [Gaertneriomyces semiglobifer]|nr:hypothetical protein BC832DRAFT_556430 [Gaertneriomyces semiglobifer]
MTSKQRSHWRTHLHQQPSHPPYRRTSPTLPPAVHCRRHSYRCSVTFQRTSDRCSVRKISLLINQQISENEAHLKCCIRASSIGYLANMTDQRIPTTQFLRMLCSMRAFEAKVALRIRVLTICKTHHNGARGERKVSKSHWQIAKSTKAKGTSTSELRNYRRFNNRFTPKCESCVASQRCPAKELRSSPPGE